MSEHEEEPEITLEEQIKILQEQGLPAEKIVEEILKEDINADVNILANILKMDKMDIGRIKGRLSSAKKRRAAKVAPGKEKEEGPVYKGELDTTSILKDILTKHPDIPGKVVEEVCSWAEYGPIHPTQLVSLLQSFRGITATTAYIVAQKYALALQKAQQEGKVTPIVLGGPVTQPSPLALGFFPTGLPPSMPSAGMSSVPGVPSVPGAATPGAMPYGTPSYGVFPSWPPQQDVRTVVKEEVRALEERLQPKEEEKYVVIEEPWRDEDGQLVVGRDHQPIMKRLRVPASQAANFVPREDAELGFLKKLEEYKKLFEKEELTAEKVRQIIKEERPATAPTSETEKPLTRDEVKAASAEAAQEAVDRVMVAHEKEDKEERRHKELLDSNKQVIAAVERASSAKTVEGYREDSFRFLGQGMHEIAQKKPIEIIIKDGGRILFGGGPPGKEVEAGAGKGLLARLQEKGYVVEQ